MELSPRWYHPLDDSLGPYTKITDIAKATGYSPSQISRILSSPDFRRTWDALWGKEMIEARIATWPLSRLVTPPSRSNPCFKIALSEA